MIGDFIGSFTAYMNSIFNVAKQFGIADFLDVAAMAFIIYHALKLVRETRAMQFIKSIVVIFVAYFIANELDMVSMKFLMRSVLDVGIIALVVLFQPELRRALEQVGRSKITDISVFGGGQSTDSERLAKTRDIIGIVTQSCKELSAKKTGALIVIERQIKLGEVIDSGTIIDASPSAELIGNIFFTNSPLHDGAMVIRGGRLYAAGCFLPLSGNMEIGRELGTRHRAALGMSEVSDAAVVVVSEETGAISVAIDSRLQRGLSPLNLQKLLTIKLSADESDGHTRHRGLLSLVDKLGRGKKKADEDAPGQK